MRRPTLLLTSCFALGIPASAWATNGMNMLSYDARVAGMAGADTALGKSALSMASNPAGITRSARRVDANLSLLIPSLTFNDSVTTPQGTMDLNTDVGSETNLFPLFGLGYSQQISGGLYGGLGIFVQGGMGADFQGLNTFTDDDPTAPATMPLPGTYDTHSQVQYMKIAPTLAYRAGLISFGASLHAGLAKMEWSHSGFQFPEGDGDRLYVPNTLEFNSGWAFGIAGRFGTMLHLFDDQLRVGASYMTTTSLSFEGDLTISNPGGTLEYDASTDDFNWPQELAVGVSGDLLDRRLVLAADFRWTQWSGAVDTVTFDANAKNPDMVPQGFGTVTLPFQMGWRDGMSVSAGGEYEIMKEFLWGRLGYNYSRTVVTDEGINALFPPVTSHHITAGVGMRNLFGGLGFDLAVEYALSTTTESGPTNQMAFEPPLPGNFPEPNGYAFDVSMSQLTTYLTVNYLF